MDKVIDKLKSKNQMNPGQAEPQPLVDDTGTSKEEQENVVLTPSVRDSLALDRTHLANERTMLAFMRTALYMVVTGLAIVNFYPHEEMSMIISWILFAIGGVIMILGVVRYFVTRSKILKLYK